MSLLFSNEIRRQLEEELYSTEEDLVIISAYCKKNALEFIESNIKKHLKSKKLMVRFAFDDILSAASDLSIYEFCKEHNWALYMHLDIHAKTYVFDRVRCIVGSANLTNRGITLTKHSNYEIAQLAPISETELSKIETLFDNSVKLNDNIFSIMLESIAQQDKSRNVYNNWSDEILNLFKSEVNVLFIHEFPNSNSLNNLKPDSLEFLDLDYNSSIDIIKSKFIHSNVYRWLKRKLQAKSNHEIYFGELSSLLHDAVINDPKPYRKEVKELQANLLNWINELNIAEIKIDKPNYSQRIRLITAT